MIRYTLKCDNDHVFESWFASGAAFDKLCAAGQIECPVCGISAVTKALMAPRVNTAGEKPQPQSGPSPDLPAKADLPPPAQAELAKAIGALRERIERETENVGKRFAEEARAIHTGDAPERAIRGEATGKDAKALIDDGISIMPLPYIDPKKVN
ncbi:DUF1178 family protein [Rhodobacteraceae bacterium SC52]|nr:DUF1178 family protein [Rhodobacteraceae bacterium SC52]